MTAPLIQPKTLRLTARPGESTHADFVVSGDLPDGSMTATVGGDTPCIQIREIVASRMISETLTDEEWRLLPPAIRDEAHRHSVRWEEAGRARAGEALPLQPGLHISGVIECAAPADAEPGCHISTLRIDGLTNEPVHIPVTFVVGSVEVQFTGEVVARPYQWTKASVRVNLPGAPDTDLTLACPTGEIEIPLHQVHVAAGQSATLELNLRAAPDTPLGRHSATLTIAGASQLGTYVPFELVVEAPIHPPEMDPAVMTERIHQHHLNTGGPFGPLGHPTSGVQFTDLTAIRQYRGGSITATFHPTGPERVTTEALRLRKARVTFVGAQCLGTSFGPGDDEPYFVTCVDMGDGQPRTEKFGPYSTDQVIFGIGAVLAADLPPNPMAIRVAAYENDEGNPDETARRLHDQFVPLSSEGRTLAAASGADAADSPGLFASFMIGFSKAGPLGSVLGAAGLLGFGDDFIGQEVALVFADNAAAPPADSTLSGAPYNVRMYVGGDEGFYELYFQVAIEETGPEPM